MKVESRMLRWMLLAGLGGGICANAVENPQVVPVDALVEGRGYAEWTAAWWQWTRSVDVPPYLDPDGSYCEQGQSGPVWFLAGTDGSFDAQRECNVPIGKYLLVPVINMYVGSPLRLPKDSKKEFPSCESLKQQAALNNDHLASAVVLLDGVQVKDVQSYRVRTPSCFAPDPTAKPQPGFHVPIAASDGYWLLIPPLPAGRHTVSVGANYAAPEGAFYRMTQNFEYVLWVGEGAQKFVLQSTATPEYFAGSR